MDWDLSTFFPTFDGPERREFTHELERDIEHVTARAATLTPLCAENQADWEAVILEYEDIDARLGHLASYVHALASCDAADEGYRREQGRLAVLSAAVQKLEVELFRAVHDTSEQELATFAARERLASARFFLERLREQARFTMAPGLEALAADLGTDGLDAWGRLYDTLAGTLSFEMKYPDGRVEQLPMAQRRSLMGDPDRRVREAAFQNGNLAWQSVAPLAAAALNAIAGTRHTLDARRGVPHFLDVALFQSATSRKALDAMLEAIHASSDLPRRFLRLKAKAMGVERVGWCDLEAPLPVANAGRVSWERAISMVKGAFSRAYPALGDFFEQAVAKRWVEYEPRPGRQPGAYCTSSRVIGESRVFMTFQGSLGDVSTLAHEMGHAFHNHVMRDLRPLARSYPMTLAESASVFAEGILSKGLLSSPELDDAGRVLLLGEQLGDAATFLLDIPVRFEFEKAFYEERKSGEVPPSRLSELMVDVQRRTFGDCLAEGSEDPMFWASKLHFFITGVSFYNFPYSFGYLLSRGLLAELERHGPAFLPRYEQLLRQTGSGRAQDVPRQAIGRDLESPAFWSDAIRTLDAPLRELETLLPKVLPQTPA